MSSRTPKTYHLNPLTSFLYALLYKDAEEGIQGFLEPPYQFSRVIISFGGKFVFEFLRNDDESFHYRLMNYQSDEVHEDGEVFRESAPQKIGELLEMDGFNDISNSFSPLRENTPIMLNWFIYELITNLVTILMYRGFMVNVTLYS